MKTPRMRALLVLATLVLLSMPRSTDSPDPGEASEFGRPSRPGLSQTKAGLLPAPRALAPDAEAALEMARERPVAGAQSVAMLAPASSASPALATIPPAHTAATRPPVALETRTVKAGSRAIAVTLVRVRLSDPRVSVQVGLGCDRVGGTEDLMALANRKGAVAAINGGFFDAYVEDEIKDPIGTIITGGEMVHKGDVGTVFGISLSKEVRMEPVRFKIVGATNGSYDPPNDWCAYWVNHGPTSMTRDHAAVYTPARGATTGPLGGTSIVVRGGKVERIGAGAQAIPEDGYVVNFQGAETRLASLFSVGTPVEYRVAFEDSSPLSGFWAQVEEGLGAGPKLVAGGEIVHSTKAAKAEGFTDSRILYASAARSALGLTRDGDLLLVTTENVTMAGLAQVMKALGSVEAMNLDGGGSRGLVYRGRYVTRSGRRISNALLVFSSD